MCRERFTFMGQNTLHPLQVLKTSLCSNRSAIGLKNVERAALQQRLSPLQNTSKIKKHRQQHIKEKKNYRYIIKTKKKKKKEKEKPGIVGEKKA